MLGGNLGHRLHKFLMLALGVVHQAHCRLRNGGERGGFARVVHTDLYRRHMMIGAQAQQGQRQPDVVVEIALGGERVFGAPMLAQNRGDHLLHRGLAV